MKTKNLIFSSLLITVFCTSVFFNSCKKNESSQINIEENVFVLDENRIDVIQNLIVIYDEEFGKVIDEELNDSRKSNYEVNTDAIATKIDENVRARILKLGILNSTQKSGEIEYIPTEGFNLESYFIELNNMILTIEDGDKEDCITKIQTTINNFIEIVKIDNSINDIEKQFVIENIVAKSGMLLTVLDYSEKLEEISDPSNLKSIQRCGWLCKKREELNCTLMSITAAGICGVSVATLMTPGAPIGLLGSAICVSAAAGAMSCWANL